MAFGVWVFSFFFLISAVAVVTYAIRYTDRREMITSFLFDALTKVSPVHGAYW